MKIVAEEHVGWKFGSMDAALNFLLTENHSNGVKMKLKRFFGTVANLLLVRNMGLLPNAKTPSLARSS